MFGFSWGRLRALLPLILFAFLPFACNESELKPEAIPLDVALSVAFDKTTVQTDSLLTMSFAWETMKAFHAIDNNLWVSVQFVGADGKLLFDENHLPDKPTGTWRQSQLIEYNRTIYVPPSFSEATATVFVSLRDKRRPEVRYSIAGAGGDSRKPFATNVGAVHIKPRPTLLESTMRSNVVFESGFYPVESSGQEEWRWTGKEARGKLQRLGERGILFLEGEVNVRTANELPTISIWIGDELRAEFTPNPQTGRFQRKLIVPESDFGDRHFIDMKIKTTRTFRPNRLSESADNRELGIKLQKIYFGPAGP
ncbi:hypothetical protein J7M28_08030 [bacterium]|nr:hypothetical protein [bacterium]